MDTLTSLLLYLLAFLFLAYVLVFGAGSTGIIGTLHYGLTDGLLLVCDKIGPWILTRRGYTAIRLQCGNLFDKPTPVFQLFYLSLILGGLFIYFAHLHHKIPFHQMSPWHSFWIPTVIISCFVTFGLASFTDPGVVTPENLRQLHTMFPVDGNLYQKKYCDTCGLDRPARSKHCRVCNRCVSRFDHHCIWINSCVGMKNLRWFLSFLWMHVVICAYGAYLIGQYVHWYISSRQLWNANFISSGKQIPASYSILFQYMMLYEAWAVILTIFLFVIAVLLFCFFAHNMWLLAHNWTTNETIRFDTIDENFNSAQYQYYIRQWSEHQSNNNKDNDTNNDNDNDNGKDSNNNGDSKIANLSDDNTTFDDISQLVRAGEEYNTQDATQQLEQKNQIQSRRDHILLIAE
eukprot:c12699_g3_i1.p1 GENE.c12699_g3_i1~~c12699_g3_i1.p1  ORF type:complete len:403 (+),score=69.89 c12699_g3_i1:1241-2449(+)